MNCTPQIPPLRCLGLLGGHPDFVRDDGVGVIAGGGSGTGLPGRDRDDAAEHALDRRSGMKQASMWSKRVELKGSSERIRID